MYQTLSFFTLLQDINHDFAYVLQYTARLYDEVVTTIASFLEPTGNNMSRRTSTASQYQHDIENQWCIVQDTDYDDNFSVDSSVSI